MNKKLNTLQVSLKTEYEKKAQEEQQEIVLTGYPCIWMLVCIEVLIEDILKKMTRYVSIPSIMLSIMKIYEKTTFDNVQDSFKHLMEQFS